MSSSQRSDASPTNAPPSSSSASSESSSDFSAGIETAFLTEAAQAAAAGGNAEGEGQTSSSDGRARRGLRSQTPVEGDPLVDTVIARLERLSKLSLASGDADERREKFLSVAAVLEELASLLEKAEEEYLKLPGKSPLFKEKSAEMDKLGHVGELILGSNALANCLSTCLAGACSPNLVQVRCAAARLLLALSSYHSFELEEFMRVATAFVWAYAEGYVTYTEPTRPQSARKRRKSSGAAYNIHVGAAMNSRTWLQANPDERRLRASTRQWWMDPKQREDAKRLRHYATGECAAMGLGWCAG